jgi:hypothetical protein
VAHFLITDDNFSEHVCPIVDGEQKKQGLCPRDFSKHPVGSHPGVKGFDMPMVPREEYIPRIQEMTANGSFMRDVRRRGNKGSPIPSLDQDGIGYCWNHSTVMGAILTRAKQGQPYVRLSAFFIGCLVKNYRDEGGWGAQSAEFMVEYGAPDVKLWPEKSMKRANDTPECRANAALHKLNGVWQDMAAAQYDRNLTMDQSISSLLLGNCNVEDFNWWGHSVLIIGLALAAGGMFLGKKPETFPRLADLDLHDEKDAKVFGEIINKVGINSWTDQWGDLGEFTLTGNKAHSDGGVAIASTAASAA